MILVIALDIYQYGSYPWALKNKVSLGWFIKTQKYWTSCIRKKLMEASSQSEARQDLDSKLTPLFLFSI